MTNETADIVNKTVSLTPNQVNTLSFGQGDLASPPALQPDGSLVFMLESGETFTIQNFRAFAESNESCGPDSLIQLSDATIIYPQQLLAELTGTNVALIAPAAGDDSAAGGVTLVNAPAEGSTELIAIERGEQYKFGFSLADAKMEQRGEDLVVNFANGGALVMQDYFAAATCDSPATLALADGVVVDPQNVLALGQFDTAEAEDTADVTDIRLSDIEPAAGDQPQLATAEQLAEIEPAAAAPGGAGGRGFGFQSAIDAANLNGISDLGALGATSLDYVAPEFTRDELVVQLADPAEPPFNPPPINIGDRLETLEDNNIGLPIVIGTPAAGDQVTITITGIPAGWTVTGPGSYNAATGTWTMTLPAGQGYANIGPRFTPPPNSDIDALDLPYTVTVTRLATGETRVANGTLDIIVDAVADAPNLSVDDNNGGVQGEPRALVINTSVTDTDGSESITHVVVRGLPTGFTLSAGVQQADGSWVLTPAQLAGLQLTPPAGFAGSVSFFVESHVYDRPNDGEFNLTNNTTFAVDRVSFSWTATDTNPDIGDSTQSLDETGGMNQTVTGNVPVDFRGDGPGTVTGNNTFSAGGSLTGGALTADGVPVTVTWNAATNTYTGMTGDVTIFTLTINNDGTYSFSLLRALDHADGTNPNDVIDLRFGVVGRDNDGDSDTGTITIRIIDDAPVAVDDVLDVGPAVDGQDQPGLGNVLTNDDLSNDGTNVVTQVTFNGTAFTVPATGTVSIVGTYGTLTIGANGSYSYVPNNSATGTDTFTYTVRDKDGDTSTANLGIRVTDTDSVPVIGDSTQTLDETTIVNSPLVVNGSVPADFRGDGPGTITGNNTFSAGGSLTGGTLSSGGTAVTVTWDAATNTYTGMAGRTAIFTLVINGDGTYTFTQFGTLDHADGSNPNDVIDLRFGVIGSDNDGDSDTGTITIRIIDDAPSAADDVATVTDDGRFASAAGNVLGNDDLSNDGPNLVTQVTFNGTAFAVPATGTVSIVGTYGTLTIGANGSYTYIPNNAATGTDSFTYTVRDGDGDTATANLSVSVSDLDTVPVVGDSTQTLDETTLGPIVVNGNVPADFRGDGPGTITGNNSFSAGGSMTGNTLSSGGQPVTVTWDAATRTYTGTAGGVSVFTLVINANGSYTFTQLGTLDHADGSNPNDVIDLRFGVIGSDNDGDSDTGTITIRIIDDAPSAANDTGTVTGNGGSFSVTGNVLTNDDLSNDGPNTVTEVTFNGTSYTVPATGTISITGQYGTLTIGANGSYTYTSSNTAIGSDGFTYTVRDSDGDTARASLTLTVADIDSVPVIGDSTQTIDETTLGPIVVNGDVPADFRGDGPGTITGNNTFSAGGSLTNGALSHNGVPVTVTWNATTNTYSGMAGALTVFTLVINANGSYTFTQFGTLDHADGSNPNDVIDLRFGVIGSDSDGDNDTGTITIRIVDDAPTAADDSINVDTNPTVTGNLLSNDQVGNDANPSPLTQISYNGVTYNVPAGGSVTINGLHGTLVANSDGTYAYTRTGNASGTDSFIYTIRDGDGDTARATLNVNVSDVDTVPVIGDAVTTFDETDMTPSNPVCVEGRVPADFFGDTPGTVTAQGTSTFGASGSMMNGVLSSSGVPVIVTLQGNTYVGMAGGAIAFTLQVNGDGTYCYKQFRPLDHEACPDPNDVITLRFGVIGTDSDGDTDTGSITINVVDDAPVPVDDTYAAGSGTVTGNLTDNDWVSHEPNTAYLVKTVTFGAATFVVPSNGSFFTIVGQYGIFRINKDGEFTYTKKAGATGTDVFSYTVWDFEGDYASANVTFNTATSKVGHTGMSSDAIPVTGDENAFHVQPVGETTVISDDMAWQDVQQPGFTHGAVMGTEVYNAETLDVAADHGYRELDNGVIIIDDFDVRQGDVIDLSGVLGGRDNLSGAIEDFVFKTEVNGSTVISVDVNGGRDVNQAIPIAVLSDVTGVNLNDVIVTNHETM
ncbi:MAG: Ig-like domain-containing protein [Pseudomonadota bacterium]